MKFLSQEEILNLLEGVEDVLTPRIEARESFFQSLKCPVCGASCAQVPHPTDLFVDGDPLPNTVARCTECAAVFDPHTKLLFSAGETTLIEPVTLDSGLSFRR